MNAQDVFGIVVRSGGLGLIAHAVMTLSAVFVAPVLIVSIILETGLGCFLFLGANTVVRAAYEARPWDSV